MPNITGNATPIIWNNQTTSSGVFYQIGPDSMAGVTAGSSLGTGILDFNASRSSLIYGNSNTVQPLSVSCYLMFYLN